MAMLGTTYKLEQMAKIVEQQQEQQKSFGVHDFFEVATISKLAKVVRYDQFTFSCEIEFSKFVEKGRWKSSTISKSFVRNTCSSHVVFKKNVVPKHLKWEFKKNYTREKN